MTRYYEIKHSYLTFADLINILQEPSVHAGRGEILIIEMSTANRKTILVLFNQTLWHMFLVSIIIIIITAKCSGLF